MRIHDVAVNLNGSGISPTCTLKYTKLQHISVTKPIINGGHICVHGINIFTEQGDCYKCENSDSREWVWK